ncbi:hypothetical protein [Microbacterium hominis]|uniref:Uncharacterized protein n=2 Tax=Microbacterium TaxID=33882 RepID=A0A2K9DMB9_9MICO|nr:hypothetical protein [Microbacterium hominis]AUG29518.1 hypothetical protein CXR34_08705 [Microbacterium hominis]EPD84219.1 hypothetical protein HMPREF1529_02284 [Microbacterium sp. oral taxon 186 str. F0373]
MHRLRKAARAFAGIRRDEGGMTFLQLAALVIGPIVIGALALGILSAVRLGGDLTTMFTRDASMTQMVERMQLQLSSATAVDVTDEYSFTSKDQPSKRLAYYMPTPGMPAFCTTNSWSFVDKGDTRALVNVQQTHESDSCDSRVTGERRWELTGFAPDSHFTYTNASGRDLHYAGGAEGGVTASSNARPEGLFANEWAFSQPSIVDVNAEMNQVFGSTTVKYSAKTPLKQPRPGVVDTDLGQLGPPVIERSFRSGDVFRATLSALTVLDDPRTEIQWSWRQAQNVGATATSLPTESQWGTWQAWTTLNYFDATVLQGAKWQVQAKYRVVLSGRTAESEVVTMTWVRPIAAPAPPTVNIAHDAANKKATISSVPATCAPGTTAESRTRYYLNAGTWTSWAEGASQTISVPEGARITAAAQARCRTPYAVSEWSKSSAEKQSVQQIVTAPKIESIVATLEGPEWNLYGTLQASLSSCPADTTYAAGWVDRRNEDPAMATPNPSLKVTERPSYLSSLLIREGERYQGRIVAKCVSPYYSASPTASRDSAWVINPIKSQPTVTNVVSSIDSNQQARVTATIGTCPAWLSVRSHSINTQTNQPTSDGQWTTLTGNVDWVVLEIFQGSQFTAGAGARCVSSYTQGPENRVFDSAARVKPITTQPSLSAWWATTNPAWGFGNGTVGTTCPAGTSLQGYGQSAVDYEGWSAGSWSIGLPNGGNFTWDAGRWMNEGARFQAAFHVRCISGFAIGPQNGPYIAGTVRPITSTPWSDVSTGWATLYHYNPRGCPAGTSYQWAYQTQNSASGWSSWSDWMGAGSVGGYGTRSGNTPYGESLRGYVTMRCVSDFTQGSQVQAMTGWSGARPWPAPSTPGGLSVSGGVVRFCDNSGWSSAGISWSPSAYASYYGVYASWRNSLGGRSSKDFGTTGGTSMSLYAGGQVSGTLSVIASVTAYNSAGSSGTASISPSQAPGCVS